MYCRLINNNLMRGRHLLVTFVTLILTYMILWAAEKQAILLSHLKNFTVTSLSDVINSCALSLNPNCPERNSYLDTKNETKQEPESNFVLKVMNFSASYPQQINESNGDHWTSSNTEVCNFAKGRWVADSKWPLYSGKTCRRWLSGMWACRRTTRTDFSYEGYRWQPEKCNMPEFERAAFLRRIQDKTIAFIGDSLGRQQFQSLMCMATGGEDSSDVKNIGKEYGLIKHPGAPRPDGFAYRFTNTNTTILYYWSSSLADLEPLNKANANTMIAMHLDRPPAFMRQFLHRFDVLVINTGNHWNKGKFKKNRWRIYINGKPNGDRKLGRNIALARNFTVHRIVKWLDSQISLHPQLKVFFRTNTPRHFSNGEWDTGGNCDNTVPLTRGSEVLQDGSSDEEVESAVKGTRVKLLDITALSKLRDEGHISHYNVKAASNGLDDCLHWCLPGIPDTWNELLAAQI